MMTWTFRPFRFLYSVAVAAIAFTLVGWVGVGIALAASLDVTLRFNRKWRFPVRLNELGVYAFGYNFLPRRAWESLAPSIWRDYRMVKSGWAWVVVKAGRGA